MKLRSLIVIYFVALASVACSDKADNKALKEENAPRIVNIINFIRQSEPRDAAITEEVLYETVHEQVKQLAQYNLPGTFLLQYDALINPKYQTLLKNELTSGSEVGAWWEITQPHVEAAGLKWRGRYSWDWHADVGFATGYTPQEREKLVDVYMDKFKSVFGYYPASVGSWFIDAHTLHYMYEKYEITASCNCKDQYGTDGYTLWGGYWNQAYYPSKKNAYMPAQTEDGQIPVPIFRMLGSDPIYQYDTGLGHSIQGVITLEPVYPDAGGDEKWIKWFFKSMFEEPCLAFNYVQAGQENSFTWGAMKKGLEMQIPLLAELRDQNKIRVESLENSGKWFKKQFPVTPATAVTALTDIRDQNHKTVWFNSRYYRANLLWKDASFRFRDIHLFDERLVSDYLTKAGTSNQCVYMTLPIVDGFLWSTAKELAGLRLMEDNNGTVTEIQLENPVVSEPEKDVLEVKCVSKSGDSFVIVFHEDQIEVMCDTEKKDLNWFLDLKTAKEAKLPFRSIKETNVSGALNDFEYAIELKNGKVQSKEGSVFVIIPDDNRIVIDCSKR